MSCNCTRCLALEAWDLFKAATVLVLLLAIVWVAL